MPQKLRALVFSLLAAAAFHPAPDAATNLPRQSESQAAKPAAPAAELHPTPAVRKLAPEIVAQHQRFQRLLPAETKREIDRLTPIFQKEVAHSKPGTDLRSLASLPIRKEYPRATPSQIAALVFELIAQSLGAPKDSMGDMSTQDQLTLQMTMQQKSQLEGILSNIMKTFQDTSDATIQNIK